MTTASSAQVLPAIDAHDGRRAGNDERRGPSFADERDRIVRSAAFRRLAGKTQVVAAPEDPLVRTRLTHTLEVAAAARRLAVGLGLDEALTEAIALAHDLGHPAFGHAGERALARVVPGGFHHAAHGVRVASELAPDLRLSDDVLAGILHHSKGRSGVVVARGRALSRVRPEALAVRAADLFAYASHDLDDAFALGALAPDDVPPEAARVLGRTPGTVISSLVERTIAASLREGALAMDEETSLALERLRETLYAEVYEHGAIARQTARVGELVEALWASVRADPARAVAAFPVVHGVAARARDTAAPCPPDDVARWFADTFAALTDREALAAAERLGVHVWSAGRARVAA